MINLKDKNKVAHIEDRGLPYTEERPSRHLYREKSESSPIRGEASSWTLNAANIAFHQAFNSDIASAI